MKSILVVSFGNLFYKIIKKVLTFSLIRVYLSLLASIWQVKQQVLWKKRVCFTLSSI
jgi:hypothetical protein